MITPTIGRKVWFFLQGRKGLEVSEALVKVAQAIPLAIHWRDAGDGTVATA